MPRYWIGVASREHVMLGVAGGFCQLCHGKALPLKRMSPGDWIVYYSPRERRDSKSACQQFTALGEVCEGNVYAYEMFPGFVPFRRDIRFLACSPTPIQALIGALAFIRNKTHWGQVFRYGYLEIGCADFALIAKAMHLNFLEGKLIP